MYSWKIATDVSGLVEMSCRISQLNLVQRLKTEEYSRTLSPDSTDEFPHSRFLFMTRNLDKVFTRRESQQPKSHQHTTSKTPWELQQEHLLSRIRWFWQASKMAKTSSDTKTSRASPATSITWQPKHSSHPVWDGALNLKTLLRIRRKETKK